MRLFPGSTIRARLLLIVVLALAPTIGLVVYSDVEGLRLGADLIGLAAAFALALAWFSGDLFIVRRARALVAATRRIADGDLSARTGVPYGRGEIGQLARAFDEMAAGLEAREAKARETEMALWSTVEALGKTDEQRGRLLERLDHAQEEERKRIAVDIHDDTLQVITAMAMRLRTLRQSTTNPEERATLERLENDVSMSMARLRRLVFELSPPILQRDGLAAALKTYLEETCPEASLDYCMDIRLQNEPAIEPRTVLYRIAQEALTNVRKHARASHVEVRLEEQGDGVLVRVRDDGVGMAQRSNGCAPGHLGMVAMRERAELAGGWSRVSSDPRGGTVVEVWVPANGHTLDAGMSAASGR
jgi:signal transduction histidine kinase